jgi:hypothetical protein
MVSQARWATALPIVPFVLLMLCSALSADEARFELPEDVPPGVVVTAKLIVSAAGSMSAYHLPTVTGLEFSSQVQQRGVSIMNGHREDWVGIEIRAATVGDYAIPAIGVDLDDGTSLKTAAVVLHVKAADERLKGVATAEASFDPPTIVPGETTHLIYHLSLQQGVRALEVSFGPPADAVRLTQEPHQQVKTALDAQGNQWQVYILTWDLTYNEAGEHVVDGQQEIAVAGDFFDQRREEIPVHPAHLLVAAIPTQGQPADFDGLIGPLQIQSRLASSQITADEGTVLSLRVEGPQAAHMHQPRLLLPSGLRSYAMDPVDEGPQRTFRWDLTAMAPGDYTIPAFSLPYFMPTSSRFQRAQCDSLRLSVAPGQRAIPSVPSDAPDSRAAQAQAPAFRDVPLRMHGVRAPAPGMLPWLLGCGLLAGLAWGAAPAAARRLQRRERHGRRLARAVAAGDLNAAASALAQLRLRLRDPDLASAAEHLREHIDLARFGSQPLSGEARSWLRLLEGL